jgi:hypothetical protein
MSATRFHLTLGELAFLPASTRLSQPRASDTDDWSIEEEEQWVQRLVHQRRQGRGGQQEGAGTTEHLVSGGVVDVVSSTFDILSCTTRSYRIAQSAAADGRDPLFA